MATTRNPHAPYIDAVTAALDAADPTTANYDQAWTSDSETGPDGETMTLSAVITWPDSEVYPSGLLVCWELDLGWQYGALRPDGSNDSPDDMPVETWADPAAVVACVAALLAGEAMPESGDTWHDPAVMAAVKAWTEL